MASKKILGLNTSFQSLKYDEFHENRFCSTISLLDYDAVVIDCGFLVETNYGIGAGSYENKTLLSEYASAQIVDDFNTVREQIVELLKQGRNLFMLMGRNENCYIYTGEKKFSGTGKNARQTNIVREFDMYSFLPIQIKATHVYGTEITICCKPPYQDFMRKTKDYSQYAGYFSTKEKSITLASISGTEKVVAAVIPYEKGKIICLPNPYYEDEYVDPADWPVCGKAYLDALFELNESLSIFDNDVPFPAWTNDIYVLDEKEEIEIQSQLEKQIAELQDRSSEQKHRIKEIQKYKLLLTASGGILEEITKKVMQELGFLILDTEKGRSDIIAKYGDIDIVAEIKGVSKSAAEKHAAQLEKWVSQFIEENASAPKGMLIVNGYCDTPLAKRVEDTFPNQMLKYCEARGHVLITTTQLLCLYIDIKKNPACAEERIAEILSCVGKYQRYLDHANYIKLAQNEENGEK